MIDIEKSVLGQIILYPQTHSYIMKLNPSWFSDFRKDLVATIQELYLSNQPVNLSALASAHRQHIREIAILQNNVSTNVYFEQEIQQLEVSYKKRNLQNKIAFMDFDKDLKELITELSTLLVESTYTPNGQSKQITMVPVKVF